MSNIYKAIIGIMKDVDPIAKTRTNTQGQGYKFRGIDDAYEALQAVMAKHGVFTVPEVLSEHHEERTSAKGSVLIYRILKIKYTFYAEDGSHVSAVVIGEAMDSGDKASNKAMSVAHKYALLQVFCIPTKDPKDPENETHELAGKDQRKDVMPEKNAKNAEPAKDLKTRMIEDFAAMGVGRDKLEGLVGKPIDKFDAEDRKRLRDIFLQMRKGTNPEVFFGAAKGYEQPGIL